MKVSMLMPALNQRGWLRDTIESARPALEGLDYEILVWDDGSDDGCCENLPADVQVFRADDGRRRGCSGSRVELAKRARGDVLFWSDPHCEFQPGCIKPMAELAMERRAWVQPKTTSRWRTERQIRFGGRLKDSSRGLRVQRVLASMHGGKPDKWPAAIGTVYLVPRTVYDHLGGWPHLPGVWGGSEQAISLACWFFRVKIIVDTRWLCHHYNQIRLNRECEKCGERVYDPRLPACPKCGHKRLKGNNTFTYRVPRNHEMANRHWTHAAFLPRSYECYWKPKLIEHVMGMHRGTKKSAVAYSTVVEQPAFRKFAAFVEAKRRRDEECFFRDVLGMDPPRGMKPGTPYEPKDEADYRREQEKRSNPRDRYEERHAKRLLREIRWAFRRLDGTPKSALALGCRDGAELDVLHGKGVPIVEGVEFSRPAVAYARKRGRNVIEGDMRHLPQRDGQFEYVQAIHSLEHVLGPEKAISEIARVLEPGGTLFLVVPMEADSQDRAHVTLLPSPEYLTDFVQKYGDFDPATLKVEIHNRHNGQREMRMIARKR